MKRIILGVLFLFILGNCYAEELATYVNSHPSKIRLEPGKGKVVATLKEGYVFTVVDEKDGYYLVVLTDGKAGWLKKHKKLFKINRSKYADHFLAIEDNRTLKKAFNNKFMTRAKSPIKIVVSLKGLTCHVFGNGIDKIYPVGVGVKGKNGRSVTPTCKSQNVNSFYLSSNTNDKWYYIKHRYEPKYFGGFPFLRLSAVNNKGYNTYGLHGPITKNKSGKWYLKRGYVSHGCARMQGKDVTEIYNIVINYPSTPVVIQEDYEYNEDGKRIDVDYPRYN